MTVAAVADRDAVDVEAEAAAALAAVQEHLAAAREVFLPARRQVWRAARRRWRFDAVVWWFDRPAINVDERTGEQVRERWLTPVELAGGFAAFEAAAGRREPPVLFHHERPGMVHRPAEFGLVDGWVVSAERAVVSAFSVVEPNPGQPVSIGWIEHPADGLVVTELSLLGAGSVPGMAGAEVLSVAEEPV